MCVIYQVFDKQQLYMCLLTKGTMYLSFSGLKQRIGFLTLEYIIQNIKCNVILLAHQSHWCISEHCLSIKLL